MGRTTSTNRHGRHVDSWWLGKHYQYTSSQVQGHGYDTVIYKVDGTSYDEDQAEELRERLFEEGFFCFQSQRQMTTTEMLWNWLNFNR